MASWLRASSPIIRLNDWTSVPNSSLAVHSMGRLQSRAATRWDPSIRASTGPVICLEM